MSKIERHQQEIHLNARSWEKKPVLRQCYREFHEQIASNLSGENTGRIVELGSGIGNIQETIPGCLRTDLFENPWIDQIENAYALSFEDQSVSDLILFDVFHHLRYPGRAFAEFARVLTPGGRVHLFEPRISLLGRIVFGLCHPEPVAGQETIQWEAPVDWSPEAIDYYAAQGNATRLFILGDLQENMSGWRVVYRWQSSALTYVLSGGYSKPQLYPTAAYPLIKRLEQCADWLPAVFATRLLVVLEKASSEA